MAFGLSPAGLARTKQWLGLSLAGLARTKRCLGLSPAGLALTKPLPRFIASRAGSYKKMPRFIASRAGSYKTMAFSLSLAGLARTKQWLSGYRQQGWLVQNNGLGLSPAGLAFALAWRSLVLVSSIS